MTMTTFLRIILLSIPGAFWAACQAQNLMPNPGFEVYNDDCANGVIYPYLDEWDFPICGYWPYYFSACAPSGSVTDVPANLSGFQYAHGGDAYIMIPTFVYDTIEYEEGNPRFYASIDLVEPLLAGEEYCLQFWLSRADSATFTTSELHAFLWYGLPSICNYNDTAWDTNAAVTFNTTGVDTVGWHLVQGSFMASGGESNLNIGSFLFGEEIDTTQIGWHDELNFSGYYLDDVYLGDCAYASSGGEGPAHELTAFPNPALRGQELTVRCSCQSNMHHWSITDIMGRSIERRSERSANCIAWETAALTPGVFVSHAQHADGSCNWIKITIQ